MRKKDVGKAAAMWGLALIMAMAVGGCAKEKEPLTNPGGMKKVGSYNVEREVRYTNDS